MTVEKFRLIFFQSILGVELAPIGRKNVEQAKIKFQKKVQIRTEYRQRSNALPQGPASTVDVPTEDDRKSAIEKIT